MSEDNSVLGCWVEVELHVEEGHMKANGRIRCVIMRVEGEIPSKLASPAPNHPPQPRNLPSGQVSLVEVDDHVSLSHTLCSALTILSSANGSLLALSLSPARPHSFSSQQYGHTLSPPRPHFRHSPARPHSLPTMATLSRHRCHSLSSLTFSRHARYQRKVSTHKQSFVLQTIHAVHLFVRTFSWTLIDLFVGLIC